MLLNIPQHIGQLSTSSNHMAQNVNSAEKLLRWREWQWIQVISIPNWMLISLLVFKDNSVVELSLITSYSKLMLLWYQLVSSSTILMGHSKHFNGFLKSKFFFLILRVKWTIILKQWPLLMEIDLAA